MLCSVALCLLNLLNSIWVCNLCRELYWALEQDMLGYNSGKGAARRFARCLPCAVGKPGKCGSGSAAWFCRRRLSVFDTRNTPLADKSQALLTCGE